MTEQCKICGKQKHEDCVGGFIHGHGVCQNADTQTIRTFHKIEYYKHYFPPPLLFKNHHCDLPILNNWLQSYKANHCKTEYPIAHVTGENKRNNVCGICYIALDWRIPVAYNLFVNLMWHFRDFEKRDKIIGELADVELLVIDEICYSYLSNMEIRGSLHRLLSERIGKGKGTILTTLPKSGKKIDPVSRDIENIISSGIQMKG